MEGILFDSNSIQIEIRKKMVCAAQIFETFPVRSAKQLKDNIPLENTHLGKKNKIKRDDINIDRDSRKTLIEFFEI